MSYLSVITNDDRLGRIYMTTVYVRLSVVNYAEIFKRILKPGDANVIGNWKRYLL